MFTFLYEILCGKNNDPIYASQIFPFVGLFTLIFAILFAIIFYMILGRWKPIWDKLSHWIMTLILLITVAIPFAIIQAKSATQAETTNAYIVKFSMANALFAFFYFVIFSLLIKKASIFAKRTPF